MHRHPWHAANHCNTTFPEFLDREWSPGGLAGAARHEMTATQGAHFPGGEHFPCTQDCHQTLPFPLHHLHWHLFVTGRPNWLHGRPYCPKYDTNTSHMPMLYESIGGVYAENILELRAWKAARAVEVCQVFAALP
jgi:hypothetical protein